MASGFEAKIGRAYRMGTQYVLVLQDDYAGEVEIGDTVEVVLAQGAPVRAPIENLAWGSALRAESPPLTIVLADVPGLALDAIVAGAIVRGVAS